MNIINRADIKPGSYVKVVQKQDQRSGKLSKAAVAESFHLRMKLRRTGWRPGAVKDILTKSTTHPHGIKVRLESGIVGRVKEVVTKSTN